MTRVPKFLLDECLPKGIVAVAASALQLIDASADVAHLLDKFPAGTPDRLWVPTIADEGEWVVITADRGSQSNIEDKLPLVCRQLRVVHVLLSAGIHKRTAFFKGLAISHCAQQLLDASSAAAGTGFSISMLGRGFQMKRIWEPPPLEATSEFLFPT